MDLFNRKKVILLEAENERLKKNLIEWIGTQNRPQYEPSPELLSHFTKEEKNLAYPNWKDLYEQTEVAIDLHQEAIKVLMSGKNISVVQTKLRGAGIGIEKNTDTDYYRIFKL